MSKLLTVKLYIDGGARNNPGPGSIGIVICDADNRILYEYSEIIGICTCNQAEYRALIEGLKRCLRYTDGEVICRSDSQLLVNQMNRKFRIKNPGLQQLWMEADNLTRFFNRVEFIQVSRNDPNIQRADMLLNNAQDGVPIDRSYE